METLEGRPHNQSGITRYDIKLGNLSGSVIELPQMGLIDSSIMAAKCIDRYAPKVVAMSGICAGFPSQAEMGQLLISKVAYEYQSGKWTTDGFQAEPYQIPMSEKLRSSVSPLLESNDLIYELEDGWRRDRPQSTHPPKLALFTSGSAVIADSRFLQQVSTHHRKVAGLDMEVFGIHRAAYLSTQNPDVLCAKVVVDLADTEKNDDIHAYGCYVSSRFVLKTIRHYLE